MPNPYKQPASFLLLWFWALACVARDSLAADYFVDQSLGNDSWSGGAQEPQPPGCVDGACTDGPWQNLSRVNQGGFSAGDRILLRCGETWRESLTVVDSGAPNNPVTFSAYGSDCSASPPKVSGSDRIASWTADSSQANVFVADVPGPVVQVFADGQYLRLAQHPDSGYWLLDADSDNSVLPGCTAHPTSSNGACYLHDSDLLLLSDLNGAGIHLRSVDWEIEDRTVTGFDSLAGEVYWDTQTRHSIRQNYGYYLDNKRWMLDTPGEWFHDAAQNKLYVWLPDSSDPTLHVIEASVRQDPLDARSVSHIAVDTIRFEHSSDDGVFIDSVNNITLDSIGVSGSAGYGVNFRDSLGTLQNSLIQGSTRDGIHVRDSPGSAITGNQVIDSGNVGAPKKSAAAIDASQSDGLLITDNSITNAGYIGIRFMRDTLVEHNIVRNSCLVLDDCGAIYTWDYAVSNPPLYNSLVNANIIIDAVGNGDGRPPKPTTAAGIYLDGGSNGVTVSGNTSANADHGVYFNSSSNHLVTGNTLFANRQSEVRMVEYNQAGELTGNTIGNNLIFPGDHRESLYLKSYFDTEFASFENNRFSLVHESSIAYESSEPAGGSLETLYEFQAWKNQRESGAEAITPFAIAQSTLDPGRQNNQISNGTFTDNASGWDRWPSNSDTDWVTGCGWDGACIAFLASTDPVNSLLKSNPLSLDAGLAYVVEFAARGEVSGQMLDVIVRRNEPGNYESVGLYETLALEPQWTHYRLPFTATDTLTTGRLDFTPRPGERVEFDDISITGVIMNTPDGDAALLINETAAGQPLPCPDASGPEAYRCTEYVDIDGQAVSWPVTVAGYASKIVIWSGSPFVDSDLDTLADVDDNCINTGNSAQKNADQDVAGDACDAFPADASEWLDTDGDGTGNNADTDDDNDGLSDSEEPALGTQPLVYDSDGDGAGDGLEISQGTSPLDQADFPVLNDGDVNDNGGLDAGDLVIAQQILLQQRTATPFELGRLDVGPLQSGTPLPDSDYTLGDYLLLQRAVGEAAGF